MLLLRWLQVVFGELHEASLVFWNGWLLQRIDFRPQLSQKPIEKIRHHFGLRSRDQRVQGIEWVSGIVWLPCPCLRRVSFWEISARRLRTGIWHSVTYHIVNIQICLHCHRRHGWSECLPIQVREQILRRWMIVRRQSFKHVCKYLRTVGSKEYLSLPDKYTWECSLEYAAAACNVIVIAQKRMWIACPTMRSVWHSKPRHESFLISKITKTVLNFSSLLWSYLAVVIVKNYLKFLACSQAV